MLWLATVVLSAVQRRALLTGPYRLYALCHMLLCVGIDALLLCMSLALEFNMCARKNGLCQKVVGHVHKLECLYTVKSGCW